MLEGVPKLDLNGTAVSKAGFKGGVRKLALMVEACCRVTEPAIRSANRSAFEGQYDVWEASEAVTPSLRKSGIGKYEVLQSI